ncbi:MAG: SET domain-containing protein-lysine N-methyltransferase [Thiohalocapsa sp. PB-PSB1]|jgi:SET domain-containing protein|nr:MAG: SET domain-containing protein-lysine N-methyltransferase [Thiohalocapsa sp. PB-PSB1]HCS90654.1 hypothetical protein [Chromatiaceae bacterium]
MDNPKAEVREHSTFGRGVFAAESILAGEAIAMFDGEFYEEGDPDYPWEVDDYVLQFAEDRWRDSKGIARVLNHSCQPNIGIRNAFRLIAMRDIAPDEELCYDYAMAEDGQWQLDCQCGSPNCRGRMAGFAALPESVRESYQGFISHWLVEKYQLDSTWSGGPVDI